MNPLLVTRDGIVESGGGRWGGVCSLNLLTAAPEEILGDAVGATRLVSRSGWIAQGRTSEDPVIPWAAGARGALDQAVEALAPAMAGRGITLLLWPRAGDVLSDIPSTLTFLRRWSGGGVGLLLEPAALIAESMLGRVEEHLGRIGEALGAHEATAAILMSNVIEGENAGMLRPSPMHRGFIEPRLLAEFARAAVEAGKPIALLEEDADEQLRAIAAL